MAIIPLDIYIEQWFDLKPRARRAKNFEISTHGTTEIEENDYFVFINRQKNILDVIWENTD